MSLSDEHGVGPGVDESQWRPLDGFLRDAWNSKLRSSTEDTLRSADADPGLLFIPFPYLPTFDLPGDGGQVVFNWDMYFVDQALLEHGRLDLVRNHIRNYLHLVDRFGYMPNYVHVGGATRSQTPIYPDGIWRYYLASGERDLLHSAYPLLKREFHEYWNAPHHQTPIGLATNRDLGDPRWPEAMAAEADTGIDWTPIFRGDVRNCVPLITNSALVRYARVLSLMAAELGHVSDSEEYSADEERRSALLREHCWNDDAGMFVEYDYTEGEQLPFVSACSYWPLWAGVATQLEAARSVDALSVLEHPYGLATTDRVYEDPHPDTSAIEPEPVNGSEVGGRSHLQWMYPAGWACMQTIAVEALDRYGYSTHAERIAARYLTAIVDNFERTGQIWEKYNVLDGSLTLPNSRYGNSPYLSWSAGAAVVLGRRVFQRKTQVEATFGRRASSARALALDSASLARRSPARVDSSATTDG